MTANEFVLSFAEAGFDFRFTAKSEGIEVIGECVRVGEGYEIKKQIKRTKSVEQSRAEIKQLFNSKEIQK